MISWLARKVFLISYGIEEFLKKLIESYSGESDSFVNQFYIIRLLTSG